MEEKLIGSHIPVLNKDNLFQINKVKTYEVFKTNKNTEKGFKSKNINYDNDNKYFEDLLTKKKIVLSNIKNKKTYKIYTKIHPSLTIHKPYKNFVHKDFATNRDHYINPVFEKNNRIFDLGFDKINKDFDIDSDRVSLTKKIYNNNEKDKAHFLALANSLLNSK